MNRYIDILSAKEGMKWHNQKEDGQNKELIQKDLLGNEKHQILRLVHIVMNQ